MSAPLLIAVVSGKGGVGKTMLSVAIASEMARGCGTLLIDFDFFNRGLTGLFASMVARSPCQRIDPPTNLVNTVDRDDWVIANVEKNLFVLSYGDLDKASSGNLESMDVNEVALHLSAFVEQACAIAACDVAILDCHGGPDNTSFAACVVSRHNILVSEPDKITLYGTLNFLRTLEGMVSDHHPDIRLVFNKVIPAFNARFLIDFYNRFLVREFAGRNLLAIYPIEANLTKAFENTPFLTTVYPTSQLATKTRSLIHELLGEEASTLVPAAFRRSSRIGRLVRRYYLGRWPKLLDPDFIFRIIAIGAIILFALPLLAARANAAVPMAILAAFAGLSKMQLAGEDVPSLYVGIFIVWLLTAVTVKWIRDLDIFVTYSSRTRSTIRAVIGSVALLAMCLAWVFFDAYLVVDSKIVSGSGNLHLVPLILLAMTLIPLAWYALWQARRGVEDIRYEKRFVEGGCRLAFSVVVPIFDLLFAAISF